MITALLIDGISHKYCNRCGFETTSSNTMLSHLNTHNLEEIETLKTQPLSYERVNKNMK